MKIKFDYLDKLDSKSKIDEKVLITLFDNDKIVKTAIGDKYNDEKEFSLIICQFLGIALANLDFSLFKEKINEIKKIANVDVQ